MRKMCSILTLLLLSALLVSSCGLVHPADELKPEATAAVIIKPIEIKAAATSTPEPVIVIRDPVKTHSPMRIQQDVPVNVSVPIFYQAIDLDGVNHCVYAFTTADGKTEFRVYAEVDELEDENVMNTLEGFFKAEIYKTGSGYFIQTNKDDNPINVSSELPCKYYPCNPPTKNNIRAYIKNSNAEAKKYNQAVANAEKKGEPLPEPTPWDGLPIYTDETPAIQIPDKVKTYKKDPTLYYYVDIYGDEVFRRYATPNGDIAGFCLSDENGKIVPGSLMIDYELDFVKENFKGRTLVDKPEDNTYRLPVYITLTSGERETVEMVYQKKEATK